MWRDAPESLDFTAGADGAQEFHKDGNGNTGSEGVTPQGFKRQMVKFSATAKLTHAR